MKLTKMEEAFLHFMQRRELLRLTKLVGKPWPWTPDEVLQTYKFTNVHRINDRTTQAFLEIYDRHSEEPPEDKLWNAAVFRWFGTLEFANAVGWTQPTTECANYILKTAKGRRVRGERTFTGAYVVTSGGVSGPKESYVVNRILKPFAKRINEVTEAFFESQLWKSMYYVMHNSLEGFGGSGFMAKEVLQDALLLDPFIHAIDRADWTPMGPGARRGILRILGEFGERKINEADAICACQELWMKVSEEWDEWAHRRKKLGVILPLTAHDIQFQLCEFDKYMRVVNGEGRPRSRYTRPSEE